MSPSAAHNLPLGDGRGTAVLSQLPICARMLLSAPAVINHNSRQHFSQKDWTVAEDQQLADAEWRTLRDTLRGSIAMFDMLFAECANSSETARVVGDARRRREKVLEEIERCLQR
jgi:hypothetical protein